MEPTTTEQILGLLGIDSATWENFKAQATTKARLDKIDALTEATRATANAQIAPLREQLLPLQSQIIAIEAETTTRLNALSALRERAARGDDVSEEIAALEA
jgi:hypothetical protein